MWDLAVREDDYTKADSLLRRKFAPDKLPMVHRAVMAIVHRDSAARARLHEEIRRQTSGSLFAPKLIALYLNDFPAAEEFARAALASPRPRAARVQVQQVLAELELAQGKWRAAKAAFALAERSLPSAKRMRALSATWPFLAIPDSELVALRAELETWNPQAEAPEATPGLASTLQPQLRLYLLGLLSSRLEDQAQALRHAAELEESDHPAEAAALVRDLARTIRAEVEWRRGRAAEALELLEPVRGEVPSELLVDPFFAEEGARYLRAELLYQLGRDREALQWFSNGFQGTPNEVAYLAPTHLRQAELHERLGDRQQAVDHYSRFIQLWSGCDPELRPSVARAKERVASLLGEPR
ncbi:MAG: tetratricopeptide repeat protein [Gemmatimonadales bacterium]